MKIKIFYFFQYLVFTKLKFITGNLLSSTQDGDAMPMTAHATRFPEFPVVKDVSCPPIPQSSGSACIMSPLPIIFALDPCSSIKLSIIIYFAHPFESVIRFPKSPTCLSLIPGQPCFFPYGLKCAHILSHLFVKSPHS